MVRPIIWKRDEIMSCQSCGTDITRGNIAKHMKTKRCERLTLEKEKNEKEIKK